MSGINKERTVELVDQLRDVAAKIRKIAKETGVNISINVELNEKYEDPCSYIRFGSRYNLERLYNGMDVARYIAYEIDPEDIRWDIPPEKFEKKGARRS